MRGARAISQALEPLESRHLLSVATVDLSGVVAASGLFAGNSPSVASNTMQSVTLTVSNNGTTKEHGSAVISYYAQLDGVVFDPITSPGYFLTKATKSLSINPGGTQNVTTSIPLLASMTAGSYDIYAVLDSNF